MKDHKDTTELYKIHDVTGPDLVLAGEVHRLVEHKDHLDGSLASLLYDTHGALPPDVCREAIAYFDQVVDSSREGIRALTVEWTPYPGRPIAKNAEERAWAFAGHLNELRREPGRYYNTVTAMLRLGPVLVDTDLATTYQLMRAQHAESLKAIMATYKACLIRTRDALKQWVSAQQGILEAHAPWLDPSAWTLGLHLAPPTKEGGKGEMAWQVHPRDPASTEDRA